MKKIMTTKTIHLAVMFVILSTVWPVSTSFGTPPMVSPISVWLEPAQYPIKAGQIELVAKIKPLIPCDGIVSTKIIRIDNLEYNYQYEWNGNFKNGNTIEYSFIVDIPPNDTSGITIEVISECGSRIASNYFVTSDDSVKLYGGNPRHLPKDNESRKALTSLRKQEKKKYIATKVY